MGLVRSVLTLRGAKRWSIGLRSKIEADVQVLNTTNTNVAWGNIAGGAGAGNNFQSGPSYGFVTRIVPPRILRFGVSYEF